jgi:hypothetical protein
MARNKVKPAQQNARHVPPRVTGPQEICFCPHLTTTLSHKDGHHDCTIKPSLFLWCSVPFTASHTVTHPGLRQMDLLPWTVNWFPPDL